jgi:Protein of unknown function (DUF3168)
MTNALQILQTAVVAALEGYPELSQEISGIFDGPPPRAVFPYVSLGDALVSEWGTKTEIGREIRLPLTLWESGDDPSRISDLIGHLEDAVAAMPRDLPGWHIASLAFLRSMIVRDPVGPWAGLVEYRVRLLAA